MGYSDYLKTLLRPLGLYQLEDSWNGHALESDGQQLDRVGEFLEEIEQESSPMTAQDRGLERYLSLLRYKPAASQQEALRSALLALLRIDNGCFTPAAINETVLGCGVNAVVQETEDPLTVKVRFPDASGEPEQFAQIRKIIEEIIPCHLNINYVFWTTTWGYLKDQALTWGVLSNETHTWAAVMSLQKD